MDVLVMLEENPDRSRVLAHVNSCSSPLVSDRPARDIVTLYGVPNVESLALALAAAVESHRRRPYRVAASDGGRGGAHPRLRQRRRVGRADRLLHDEVPLVGAPAGAGRRQDLPAARLHDAQPPVVPVGPRVHLERVRCGALGCVPERAPL